MKTYKEHLNESKELTPDEVEFFNKYVEIIASSVIRTKKNNEGRTIKMRFEAKEWQKHRNMVMIQLIKTEHTPTGFRVSGKTEYTDLFFKSNDIFKVKNTDDFRKLMVKELEIKNVDWSTRSAIIKN